MKRVALVLAALALIGCPAHEPPPPLASTKVELLEPEAKLELRFRRDFLPQVRKDTTLRLVVDLTEQPDLLAIGRDADAHGGTREQRKAFVDERLRAQVASERALADELRKRPDVKDVVTFHSLARIAFTGPASLAKELALRPDVAWGWGRSLEAPAPRPVSPERPPGEGSTWGPEEMGARQAWAAGKTGRGVHVCVLDSAAASEPPQLHGRRAASVTSHPPPGASLPDDGRGHGFAVLGAAVGAGGIGVAPDASWSVANPLGGGVLDPEAFAATIDWLLDEARPDVVVMPWDLPGDELPDWQLAIPIGALRTAGMGVAFPAGNTGPTMGANSPPANLIGLAPDGAPAFSVGGVMRDLSSYEPGNRGPNAHDGSHFPQACAPAADVSVIDPDTGGLRAGWGTSYASGFGAGALAVVLGTDERMTGPQAETLLRESARDLGEPGDDDVFGHGLVDVAKAVGAR